MPADWKVEDVLGWSAAQNKWGDPTGIYHLQVSVPLDDYTYAPATTACGTQVRLSGQVLRDGVGIYIEHLCRRCVASWRRAKDAQS